MPPLAHHMSLAEDGFESGEALDAGAQLPDGARYQALLDQVEAMVDATQGDEHHPLWGLIDVAGDRLREYESRAYPWHDKTTPAELLAYLMQEHDLRQSDLPELGSQGVVSEILAGRCGLKLSQVQALAQRFAVSPHVFEWARRD